eukprot:m.11635 g.11635  ORF g.11635 m.11635 type:complete len:83 (-) comp6606_c0_seq1:164-412(-)
MFAAVCLFVVQLFLVCLLYGCSELVAYVHLPIAFLSCLRSIKFPFLKHATDFSDKPYHSPCQCLCLKWFGRVEMDAILQNVV